MQGLKNAFTKLMTIDRHLVHKIVYAVVERLSKENHHRQLCVKEKLMLQLSQQWPGDVGILAVPFLNVVSLDMVQFPRVVLTKLISLYSLLCLQKSRGMPRLRQRSLL